MDVTIPFSVLLSVFVLLLTYLILKKYLVRNKVWAYTIVILIMLSLFSYSMYHYESKFKIAQSYDFVSPVNTNITAKWAVNIEDFEPIPNFYQYKQVTNIIPDGNNLYVSYHFANYSSDGAGIYCLSSENGTIIWETHLEEVNEYGPIYNTPGSMVLFDNCLYVTSGPDKLFCLNTTTGKAIWETTLEGGASQRPVVIRYTNNTIFYGGTYLYELNIDTGEILYQNKDFYGLYGIYGDKIITSNFTRLQQQITCLNYSSNETIWEVPFRNWINVAFNQQSDKIVVICQDRHIYCFNTDDGTEIWNKSITYGTSSNTPLIIGDRVYFNSGNFYCLDINNGNVIFNVSCPTTAATPVLYSDSEVLLQEDGFVYLFSLIDYTTKWKYHNGGGTSSLDGHLILMCESTRFYLPIRQTIMAFDKVEPEEMSFFVFPQDFSWQLVSGDEEDITLIYNFILTLRNNYGFITTPESYYYIINLNIDGKSLLSDVKVPLSKDGLNIIEVASKISFNSNVGAYRYIGYDIQLYCDEVFLQEEERQFPAEVWNLGGATELFAIDEVCGITSYILSIIMIFGIFRDFILIKNEYNQRQKGKNGKCPEGVEDGQRIDERMNIKTLRYIRIISDIIIISIPLLWAASLLTGAAGSFVDGPLVTLGIIFLLGFPILLFICSIIDIVLSSKLNDMNHAISILIIGVGFIFIDLCWSFELIFPTVFGLTIILLFIFLYIRSIRLNTNIENLMKRGQTHEKKGEFREAIYNYQMALQLNPYDENIKRKIDEINRKINGTNSDSVFNESPER